MNALSSIARYFFVQHNKTGKNITMPNNHKIYQMATQYTKWQHNTPNGNTIHQMAVK
jgi:hypothetical protein